MPPLYDPFFSSTFQKMTTSLPIPDYTKFEWKSRPDDPCCFVRFATGSESLLDFWRRHGINDKTLYLGVYFKFACAVREDSFLDAAKQAWGLLRFQIPTLAARLEVDDQDNTLIVYRCAESSEDVQNWVSRTLRVTRQSSIDLAQLRWEVGTNKIPTEDGDNILLHLVPGPRSDDGLISTFGILIQINHALGDVAAMKLWTNKYLTHLCGMLSVSNYAERQNISWGTEGKNLTPAVTQIFNSNEVLPVSSCNADGAAIDQKYYTELTEILAGLANGPKVRHPTIVKTVQLLTRRCHTRVSYCRVCRLSRPRLQKSAQLCGVLSFFLLILLRWNHGCRKGAL